MAVCRISSMFDQLVHVHKRVAKVGGNLALLLSFKDRKITRRLLLEMATELEAIAELLKRIGK